MRHQSFSYLGERIGGVSSPPISRKCALSPPTHPLTDLKKILSPVDSPPLLTPNSLQKVVFSFEQSLDDQNNFSSGSHHPITPPPSSKMSDLSQPLILFEKSWTLIISKAISLTWEIQLLLKHYGKSLQ